MHDTNERAINLYNDSQSLLVGEANPGWRNSVTLVVGNNVHTASALDTVEYWSEEHQEAYNNGVPLYT